jgi:hypothetical protein
MLKRLGKTSLIYFKNHNCRQYQSQNLQQNPKSSLQQNPSKFCMFLKISLNPLPLVF